MTANKKPGPVIPEKIRKDADQFHTLGKAAERYDLRAAEVFDLAAAIADTDDAFEVISAVYEAGFIRGMRYEKRQKKGEHK